MSGLPAGQGPNRHRPNYLWVFLALTVFTGLEIAVTYISAIPRAPFLLSLSFVKAILVVLYFMHLRYDNRWYVLIFLMPFLLIIPLLLVINQ